METPHPESVDDDDVTTALATGWALKADMVRYVPKGGGSYHWIAEAGGEPAWFVTVDDLDTKPWIGATRDSVLAGLAAAYEAAFVIQHQADLDFVVGPLQSSGGSVTVPLSEQYSMAVFPFVDGQAGSWGDPPDASLRETVLQMLASLHTSTVPSSVRIGRRALDLPERPMLLEALDSLDRPWEGGPLSEPARHLLERHAGNVTARLEHFDLLADRLGETEDTCVVTHGEPHPGNLIQTPSGLRLIDWDTVALARPERDLWMLDAGSADRFATYEDRTGIRVDDTAIAFYRLTWTLSDIACVAELFRSAHQESASVRQKWHAFGRLLEGESSTPFGAP